MSSSHQQDERSAEPVAELNRRFGIPGVAEVAAGNGGLTRVIVSAESCEAELYLHGAQVTHWKPRHEAGPPILWTSRASLWEPRKAIRGGIPICFPWFGAKEPGPKESGAKESGPAAPAHGFARLMPWKLESIQRRERGDLEVKLSLHGDETTRELWPYEFQLECRIVFGQELTLQLELANLDTKSFSFEEAFHTYFQIGSIHDITIKGLEGIYYIDRLSPAMPVLEEGPIVISSETDRVYMDSSREIELEDRKLRRRIRISKLQSRTTVVWNPWSGKAARMADFGNDEWPEMVCIESCNLAGNKVTLAPGQRHVMGTTISVLPL